VTSQEDAGPGRRPRLVTPVFVVVLVSTLAYFMSVGLLLPVLPRYIEGPLGGTDVAVGISIGAFSIVAVILRPLAGRAGDRRGRRPLIVGGALIVAASVACYSLVHSLASLLVFRCTAGAGEAMFFTGSASIITDIAPEERRGEAVSIFSLALYGGLSLGPILGETIFGHHRYHAVWWTAAAFGLLAALAGLAVRTPAIDHPADVEPAPIVHPAAVLPGLVLASVIWGFSAFSAFVTLYALKLGLGGSRYVFFTYSFTVLLIRFFGARLPDVLGARRAATIATAAAAGGMVIMGAWGSPSGLYAGSFLLGIGGAFAFPAGLTLALHDVPASQRGAVVGTFTAFFDLSYGIGAVSLGAVAHALGYRGTFAMSAVVAAAGLVLLRTKVHERQGA